MIDTHLGSERWQKAQEAEIKWWLNYFIAIRLPKTKDGAALIRKYSKERMDAIMKVHDAPTDWTIREANCLEVGSGPVPFLIAWPQAKLRLAIDPLHSEYQAFTHFKMGEKNFGVWIHPIKAENFHYWKAKKFDIIICSNVLDHCDDPKETLQMMLNNLDEDGAIYMDLYLREPDLRLEHPHGWKDVKALEAWMTPILGEHFRVEYVRVMCDKRKKTVDTDSLIANDVNTQVQKAYIKIKWVDTFE